MSDLFGEQASVQRSNNVKLQNIKEITHNKYECTIDQELVEDTA